VSDADNTEGPSKERPACITTRSNEVATGRPEVCVVCRHVPAGEMVVDDVDMETVVQRRRFLIYDVMMLGGEGVCDMRFAVRGSALLAWHNTLFFFVFFLDYRVGGPLPAGHTHSQVNLTARGPRHSLTDKRRHLPYFRRCPAPGPKKHGS
jgi:hypothetical protein